MRLSALKHLVESVHALVHSERIYVLGSSSLLATFPQLGEPGGPLEVTFDADLLIQPCDEQIAAMVHEAIGDGSLFARRTGYHADLLRPEITNELPAGWESRLVSVDAASNSAALNALDLLIVKLRTGRSKDLELCRAILHRKLLTPAGLKAKLDATPLPEKEILRIYQRFEEITGGIAP